MINDKKYLDDEREIILRINDALNSNSQSMEEIYDAGVINITIDPHRSLLAMADLATGFSVVSAIHFHFVKNCTSIDFNCSDNPIVYFPADSSRNNANHISFVPHNRSSSSSRSQNNIVFITTH
jgi:hypothetical protein